jgi:hypothetical protein
MSVNPILAAFAPALSTVLTQLQNAAGNIAANPTVENAIAQGEVLALDAISPAQLEGLSIGGLAQEVSTVIATLQAHLAAATAAPTVATAAAPVAGA